MPKHLFVKEDPNIKQKALKLYKQGFTMREVGKRVKRSRQWVCNVVNEKLGRSLWKDKNKEKARELIKKWKKGEKGKAYHRKYRVMRRKKNPKLRLDENMGSAIYKALKGKKAGRKWEKLTGYTIEDLIKHLERQFDRNMNWQNYGTYWWVDHIRARSLFDYKTAEDPEFKKCWVLENLQPMERIANIKKSNRIDST